MGHSLILWTASLLAQSGEGQVLEFPAEGQPRSCGCQAAPPAPPVAQPGILDRVKDRFHPGEAYQQPGDVNQPQAERPGFFARLKDRMSNLLNRPTYAQQAGRMEMGVPTVDPSDIAHPPTATVTTNEPPLSTAPAGNKIVQAGYSAVAPPAASGPMPSQPVQVAANTGVIAPKFVNKIGHEEDYSWVTGQLGVANGQWVIHYATPDTIDNFGGKLVLVGNQNMSGFQVGDLVSVQGGLMAQNGRLGGAYQVHNVTLMERK